MKLRLPVLSSIAAVLLSAFALPLAAQSNDYIVTFRPGTTQAVRGAAAARHGASVRFNYDIIDAVAATIPNENVLRAFGQDASVQSITPDYPVYASQSKAATGGGTPNAIVSETLPLGVQRVGAPTLTSTGAGIGVAIVDTGIDLTQPDLAPIAGGYNAIKPTSSCQDDNGHGTHVAGTVAALSNTRDVVGVAPGAKLYCVKVLNSQGTGSWATIISGLDWIYNAGVPRNPPIRVVNMSLGGGGTDSDTALRQAIARLYNAGIVVVVAAGNDATLDVSQQVPAAYARSGYVITVASTTAAAGTTTCSIGVNADTASFFTSDGVDVTISAPGEDSENVTNRGPNCYLNSVGILSLKLGGGTTRMSGTSMSTPHVAGIVARLLENPVGYGLSNPPSVTAVQTYFKDIARGANRLGTAPLDSPATSYTSDTIREGVAVIH